MDAWLINIGEATKFGSGFLSENFNPNF